MSAADQIRELVARLINLPDDSEQFRKAAADLKKAMHEHAEDLRKIVRDEGSRQQREWDKSSQPDVSQKNARQPYFSRESDSADGFAEGLKLFNPRKKDSEKKTD